MTLAEMLRRFLSRVPREVWIFLVFFALAPAVLHGQTHEPAVQESVQEISIGFPVCVLEPDSPSPCGVTTPGNLIQIALEDQFLDCLAIEEARGGTLGRAYFTGMPWDGGDYGVGIVPGMGMDVVFADDTTYVYGGEMSAVVADNLSSLQKHWAEGIAPPYDAVRRADGSIHILTSFEDCRSWQMVPPSIIIAGWENHELAWCLQAYGAFRATDTIAWQSNMRLVADFGDEEVLLETGIGLAAEAIVAETFEGFAAFEAHGDQCSAFMLHQIP